MSWDSISKEGNLRIVILVEVVEKNEGILSFFFFFVKVSISLSFYEIILRYLVI